MASKSRRLLKLRVHNPSPLRHFHSPQSCFPSTSVRVGSSSFNHAMMRLNHQRMTSWFSSSRPSSSSFAEKEEQRHPQRRRTIAEQLNYALQTFPHQTFGLLFASDILSIYGFYELLNVTQVPISSEFALAFVVSRPLRKLRLPLDLAFTAGVAKLWPATTTIHLGSALQQLAQKTNPNLNPGWFHRAFHRASSVLDQYGAAYLIGSRVAGVVVVGTLYGLLGFSQLDLTTYLHETWGIDPTSADTVGTWAAAVVLSSAVYPLTLACTGYIAPVLGRVMTHQR